MSLFLTLRTVRDLFREQLTNLLPEDHIRVMPDGRVVPWAGDRFIAVHPTRWDPAPGEDDLNRGLAENYAFDCTVTYRTPYIPQESLDEEIFLKTGEGMEALCRLIIVTVHQNVETLTDTTGLLEYPRWAGTSMPLPVGPDWFYSSPDQGGGFEEIQSGLTMTVSFRDAYRIQSYEDGLE